MGGRRRGGYGLGVAHPRYDILFGITRGQLVSGWECFETNCTRYYPHLKFYTLGLNSVIYNGMRLSNYVNKDYIYSLIRNQK